MPRFDKTITLGNILTVIGMAAGVFALLYGSPGDAIRVEARVTTLEVGATQAQQRDLEFQRDVRQQLTDIRNDVREIRSGPGFRFSELPPSAYRDRR